MSWGRFDDSVSSNPKLSELNDRERRILGDGLWAYCARERNGGHFNVKELHHAYYHARLKTYRCTNAHLHHFIELGLVDDLGDGQYKVHNWERYQPQDPTAAERQRRHRAKQQRDSHNRDNRDNNTTRHDRYDRDSRAGDPSRPVTTLEPKAVAGTTPNAATATYENHEDHQPDRTDPVIRLLVTLRDRDGRTERVLRSFVGQVPEAAFDFTRDEIDRTGGGAGKAVRILQRIQREGVLVSPDDLELEALEPTPERGPTVNGSGQGFAYIAGLIANGVLTLHAELDDEFAAAELTEAERGELLARLEAAR
jgi:hypothetical protein